MSKTGRPLKDIDWVNLDGLLCLDASLDYCCEQQILVGNKKLKDAGLAPVELCDRTIQTMRKHLARHIRRRFNCTFAQYRDKKMEGTKLTIKQEQIKLAKKGNATMLIWLGKVLLGQREEQSAVTINNHPASADNTAQSALSEIREILKAKECSSTPTPPLSLVSSQGLLGRQ